MAVGRREVLLGGVGLGLAMAAGPRAGLAQCTLLRSFSSRSVRPGGGAIDQTAALQAAADAAAAMGVPLYLPAGIYSTAKLTLKSGTRIEGVPGKTILRYREGGALIALDGVANVRLSGVVLDGDAKPLQERGALLTATEAKHLDITHCRLTGSTANGVSLRKVSGSIKNCEIGAIRNAGLLSEDADGLEVAGNLIERVACGIAVASFAEGGRLSVIKGNRIRNLFIRKQGEPGGHGVAVEADAVVTGNVIEGAPACGIMIGWGPHLRDVSVAENVIRDAFLGIGVSVDPSSGNALIAKNVISGAKDGAIRAMSGPASIGPDLATASAEPFTTLAIYANIAG